MAAFIDGFEQFLGDPLTLMPMAGYSIGEVGTAEGRRPGSAAILVSSGAVEREQPVSGDVFSAGVACRFDQRGGPFLTVQTAVVQVDPVTGLLNLNGETGEVIPAAGRYYYYEIELDFLAEEARLYVNGKLDVVSAYTGAAPGTVSVQLTGVEVSEGAVSPVSFDDLYLNSGNRLGPIEVATQLANEDSAPQDWLPSVEDESHALIVGAQPPDPLNRYVLADVAGTVDRFNSTTALSRNDEVKATSMIALARVTRRTDQQLLLASGPNQATADALDLAYQYRYVPIEYGPGTMAQAVADSTLSIEVGAPV